MKISKRTVGVSTAVLVIVGGSSAFAYWTSTGSGSGTGTASSGETSTIALTTGDLAGLYPGFSVTKDITAKNNGTQSATVETVSVGSPAVAVDATHATAGCLATWFTPELTQPAAPVGLAAGASGTTGSVKVTMSNELTTQDSCKGATITVNLVTP